MEAKNIIAKICWLIIYSAIFILFVPMLAGFAGGAFEREFLQEKFVFYQSAFYLLGIAAVYVLSFIHNKKDNLGVSTIHDPEEPPSILSIINVPKFIRNPILFFILCWIVFAPLFLFASQRGTAFSAIPHLEQQVTKIADIAFAIWPAAPAETLGAIFIIALSLFLLRRLVKKQINKGFYIVLAIFIAAFVSGLYGYLIHLFRYGFSEVAVTNVIIFWSFGGLITAIFNSAIPFLVMHDCNNLFVKLNEIFSSEIVFTRALIFIFVAVILYVVLLFLFRKRKVEI